MNAFNGVRVFCATVWQQRAVLDEQVDRWLEAMRQRPDFEVVDIVIAQSSDDTHHCLSILVFFNKQADR